MRQSNSALCPLYPEPTAFRTVGVAEVPAYFSDTADEYRALREAVGVLDYSSCGPVFVRGADALDTVQELVTRDVEFMFPDRCVMALILDEDARVRDIVVIYRLDGGFMLETAFGQTDITRGDLESVAGNHTVIEDGGSEYSIVGIEGPAAPAVIDRTLGAHIAALPFRGVEEGSWNGTGVVVARSGFTGEFGYKIFASHETSRSVWEHFIELGAIPCGLDALETAMVEVRQPIFHRECASPSGVHVATAGLNWLVDPSKPSHRGRQAMLDQHRQARLQSVAFVADDPDQDIASKSPVFAVDRQIGEVVHSTRSPGLGRSIGICHVQAPFAASGLPLRLSHNVDELSTGSTASRDVLARTTSSPLVVPTSWYQRDPLAVDVSVIDTPHDYRGFGR